MSSQQDYFFYLVFHLNALECNALKYYFAHGVKGFNSSISWERQLREFGSPGCNLD